MSKQLAPGPLLLLTFALSLGTFIQILDFSIANVSLPQISKDFGISPMQSSWIITSYTISSAVMLALTGWLAGRFGPVFVYITSILLFSLASALCGLAPTNEALILFRSFQGVAGGALVPLSQTLLLMNYPPNERGRALGIWSTMIILAPLVGPFVGGALTSLYGWRWIFFINIPLGVLSAFITYSLIGKQKEDLNKNVFDLKSFVFLALGVSLMQVFLDKGHKYNWFHSNFILSVLCLSIFSIGLFIHFNRKSKEPIFDFSLFTDKNFVLSTLIASFAFLIFIGSSLILPLWLQLGLNYTPMQAGISLMPIGIFPLLLSTTIGKSLSKIDPRYYLTISFVIFAATFFWLSTFNKEISNKEFLILRLIQGLGPALYFIPVLTLALSTIPKRKLASATGFFNFSRLISGGGIGIAVFITFWEYKGHLYMHFSDNKEVINTAYTLAMNDIAFLSALGFLILIPFVWMCKHHQQND
jgi:DHA2 family multidrug resistance protein